MISGFAYSKSRLHVYYKNWTLHSNALYYAVILGGLNTPERSFEFWPSPPFRSVCRYSQEQSGWEFDSAQARRNVSKSDAEQVYDVLLKMLDRWNARDIEGHLGVYWKSPELLVVIDSEQFNGWQQLHDSYINGYPDRSTMGFIQPKRIQVKLLKPDLALALTWWSVTFPSSKQTMVGNSTWTPRNL